MLAGERIYIGAPDSLRDYMYVTDHVGAYVAALAHPEIQGEAFNVSTGDVISNRDLAFRLAGMLGYPKKRISLGNYPPNYPMRPIESDQVFINLDYSKIKKMMNWKPTVSLNQGLETSVQYWRKSYAARRKAR
jgi:nucleoside-diphosphate-sugar epimerase